jgi:phage terminase small subunit
VPPRRRPPTDSKPKTRLKRTRGTPFRPDAIPEPTFEKAFAIAYIASGENGTRAYLELKPDVKRTTAAVEASKLLRDPNVRRLVEDERSERFAKLEMQADEAVALISLSARADIGDAYDEAGNLLPVHTWPVSLRLAVKGIKPGPFGDTITLHDGLRARELMAQIQGRLKNTLELKFDHAKYLGDAPPEE